MIKYVVVIEKNLSEGRKKHFKSCFFVNGFFDWFRETACFGFVLRVVRDRGEHPSTSFNLQLLQKTEKVKKLLVVVGPCYLASSA